MSWGKNIFMNDSLDEFEVKIPSSKDIFFSSSWIYLSLSWGYSDHKPLGP